jgi:uncharacterized alpha-E superfamily protein
VLKSLNAYQMYRRHGGAQVRGTGVVTYLVKDPHLPRSVHYCLEEIESCLVAFPMNAAALKLLRTAQRRVEGMRFDGLSPAQRHEYLDAIQADLAGIHEEISSGYFHRHEQSSALLAAAG